MKNKPQRLELPESAEQSELLRKFADALKNPATPIPLRNLIAELLAETNTDTDPSEREKEE
ncbi:MAG: hypothetical protein LC768_18470 [Acidobacteria bacterium]|nr:hypothetical protein [Acidobacteriota bacterium]MCA1640275.1 hypothetical protein [Acidobacteriota bacterium]